MRLSRPSFSQSLAASSLTVALSCTSLPALAGTDQPHTSTPAVAEQARQQAADHTQALMALQKRWAKAQGTEKSRVLEQMIARAEERRAFLLELIKTNPAEVLRVSIPEEKQAGMPAEVVEKLEQKLELEGELEVFYEDYEDGSHRLRHLLKTRFGERFELHFAGKAPQLTHGAAAILTGALLESAEGARTSDGDIALTQDTLMLATGSTTTSSDMLAAGSPTFGVQTTLVVNINFSDNTSQPWTPAQAQSTILGTASDFILENSFGQTSLSGVVTPWLTLPLTSASCDTNAILQAGQTAAAAAGYDLSQYNRRVFAMPYNSSCPFSGLGSVGGVPSSTLINGSMQLYTVAHELGHNLGLYHSHALECGSAVIGSSCTTDEYGDGVDIMGRIAGHYSAFQKERLGWLDSSNTRTVTSSGIHEIEGYAATQGSAPKALKIAKGTDASSGQPAWYYVEYRQATGFDSIMASNANVQNGVVIHSGVEGRGNTSYMLDMTPGSGGSNYTDTRDPALEVGYSFTDPQASLTLATEWVDAGRARINVQLDGTTASCTRANPGLSFSPAQGPWVAAGTTVSYNVTVKSNDSSACSNSSYSLSTSKPSGWNTSFGNSSLTLAPGASKSTTLTVSSTSTATDGFYNLNVTAASGSYSLSGTVTYVVDNPTTTNAAPVAKNDSASTSANTAVTINVLANDSDPDGDALTVSSTSGVNGTAKINSNGTITFTPASGFGGLETFSYSISDGKGASASATVSVSVAAPPSSNSAPVAVNDSVTLSAISPVTIPVLGNDWDPEGAALTISGITQGAKGNVTINANGTLTYTPGKPFKNEDSFSYSISDGEKTASAVVSIQLDSSSSGGTGGNNKGKGNKP